MNDTAANSTDKPEPLVPPADEECCSHCNGTGLSDPWDEDSYCEWCWGMGYIAL